MITTLVAKEEIATGTMAFHFAKPNSFSFRAGNTIDVTLEDRTYTFSIASAPHEPTLMIAIRMRDTPFKRALNALPIGSEVAISDSMGVNLHNDVSKRAVFLTGGIGITLVRSIVVDCAYRKTAHRLVVFSSNRTAADAPFLDEMTTIDTPLSAPSGLQGVAALANYRFVPTMTQDSQWTGEKGYIDAAMIDRHVSDVSNTIWYLTGPAAMVKAMRGVLTGMDVDDDYIKTEEFSGY